MLEVIHFVPGTKYRSNQDLERQTGIYVNNMGFNGSSYHQGFLGRKIGESLPGGQAQPFIREAGIPRGTFAQVYRAQNGNMAVSVGGTTEATIEWLLNNLD